MPVMDGFDAIHPNDERQINRPAMTGTTRTLGDKSRVGEVLSETLRVDRLLHTVKLRERYVFDGCRLRSLEDARTLDLSEVLVAIDGAEGVTKRARLITRLELGGWIDGSA